MGRGTRLPQAALKLLFVFLQSLLPRLLERVNWVWRCELSTEGGGAHYGGADSRGRGSARVPSHAILSRLRGSSPGPQVLAQRPRPSKLKHKRESLQLTRVLLDLFHLLLATTLRLKSRLTLLAATQTPLTLLSVNTENVSVLNLNPRALPALN